MTRADDIRAAAEYFERSAPNYATRLRQHADTIERVEQEMRYWQQNADPTVRAWADTLRGDTT